MVALTPEQQALVEDNLNLVKYIANRTVYRTPAFDTDDAIGAGMVGLTQAARRYKPSEVRFSTFASRRISGAIKDEMRFISWMTLDDRRKLTPGNERQLLSLDAPYRDDEGDTGAGSIPDESSDSDFNAVDNAFVWQAVKKLPRLEAEIIMRTFGLGEKGRDVARVVGLSDSRTSQVKANALRHLREIIEEGNFS